MRKKLQYLIIFISLTQCRPISNKQIKEFYFFSTRGHLITYSSKKKSDRLLVKIKKLLKRKNLIYSRYNPNSELYTFNQSPTDSTYQLSSELFNTIKESIKIHKATKVFDISLLPVIKLWDYKKKIVPSEQMIKKTFKKTGLEKLTLNPGNKISKKEEVLLDLGGIAKGAIIDSCVRLLKKQGIKKGVIEIGGDLYAFGKKWNIGINDPISKKPAYLIQVKDMAVVTSGDYERFFTKNGITYSHIIDPRTGRPAVVKAHSVTVIGPKTSTADALATAFFILGPQKSQKILSKFFKDYSFFFILKNFKTKQSSNFKYKIEKIK